MVDQVEPLVSVRRKMVVARIEFMGRLAEFKNEQLMYSLSADEPSALQVVYHLYVIDSFVLQQMRRVQTEDDPELVNPVALSDRYYGEAVLQVPSAFTLETILTGMIVRREEMFSYLSQLPTLAWERAFHFSATGQMRFYQLCNLLALHDQQHAHQLASIKARLDSPSV